jgi:phosphoribosyl-ATP pyrophosphohydrolase
MDAKKLIERAMDLVIRGRASRDLEIKDEVFDGLWELLVNLDYELQRKGRVPVSPN